MNCPGHVHSRHTVFPRIVSSLEQLSPLNICRTQNVLIINSFLPWIIVALYIKSLQYVKKKFTISSFIWHSVWILKYIFDKSFLMEILILHHYLASSWLNWNPKSKCSYLLLWLATITCQRIYILVTTIQIM